ncbi:hypothetical protein, partial [Nocardia carnea]|uniref:hypothetical protein n=1 Tax=Nocardia carnea TaxID=37328 RepID=UPI003D787D85
VMYSTLTPASVASYARRNPGFRRRCPAGRPTSAGRTASRRHRTHRPPPTRLGRHLEDLAARGILSRERGGDQRQHTVRITHAGRTLHNEVKRKIRTVEDELLDSALSTGDAARFRGLLTRLAVACE